MSAIEPGVAVRAGSAAGRWVVVATVLGSGIAFLDGSVVNVALPAIGEDLGADMAGLQWILDAYLVTLTGLLLLGGSLGDRYGRKKMYVLGLVGFTIASVLCAAAPTTTALVFARALQGAGGALLVPGSLAIISSTFHPDDRGRAVGSWAALSGVSTAIGPFLGGWLVEAFSWRWIFVINVPIAAVAVLITLRHVPETRDRGPHGSIDVAGAVTISVGLAALAYGAIEGPAGEGGLALAVGAVGAALLVAFVVIELHSSDPMLPLGLFRSTQFTGANLTTLAVYGGLGAATFLVVLELQLAIGYSPIAAGASLLPLTIITLLLSPRAGALAQRIGPRLPMTVGPIVVGLGLLLYVRIAPGASFWTDVLPGSVVLGLGLACTVAPLTSTVLGAVDDEHVGVASGVNNAVARLAGLLAVAVLPGAVGLDVAADVEAVTEGFHRAMMVSAVLCFLGGAIAFATIRKGLVVDQVPSASPFDTPCHDACLARAGSSGSGSTRA
jgi:EmrB/QacA subfamily drug resistance transporter